MSAAQSSKQKAASSRQKIRELRPVITGIILAAGDSSRMGQDKALLTYRGRTFLETILSTLREAGLRRMVVVLGHHAEEIRHSAEFGDAQIVINADYTRGQTSSLQAGIKALESEDLEAIVLCLVDQPAVSAESVRKLIQTYRQSNAPVVIPTFQNRRGHPVLIGCALLEELRGLGPDEGANNVMRKYRRVTEFVEVDDPGILLDVDDPETYRGLESV